MSSETAQPIRATRATPIHRDERSVVIFDDLSRISWKRLDHAHWQLVDIWPTHAQRTEVLKSARDGELVLIVVQDRSESESAFIDEIPPHLTSYALDIGAGLVEISVKHGDWLPHAARSRLEKFIQAESALRQCTPRLLQAAASLYHDRRTNLFFLYVDTSVSWAALEQQLGDLIESLTPPQLSPRRREASQIRRWTGWSR